MKCRRWASWQTLVLAVNVKLLLEKESKWIPNVYTSVFLLLVSAIFLCLISWNMICALFHHLYSTIICAFGLGQGRAYTSSPENCSRKGLQFIVDGGAFFTNSCGWSTPVMPIYNAMYIWHVRRIYGCALVVFDGYHDPTTKDEAHHGRIGSDIGVSLPLSAEMLLSMSKKACLANTSNKKALINLFA